MIEEEIRYLGGVIGVRDVDRVGYVNLCFIMYDMCGLGGWLIVCVWLYMVYVCYLSSKRVIVYEYMYMK